MTIAVVRDAAQMRGAATHLEPHRIARVRDPDLTELRAITDERSSPE